MIEPNDRYKNVETNAEGARYFTSQTLTLKSFVRAYRFSPAEMPRLRDLVDLCASAPGTRGLVSVAGPAAGSNAEPARRSPTDLVWLGLDLSP